MPKKSLLAHIATLGPVGFWPYAAGTYASFLTLPLVWVLHRVGLFWAVGAATLIVIALGFIATRAYLAEMDKPDGDPSEVVIDEVAGMMIALWPLS
ncbi:MAG: phosphatidylglycerophosphatase A, partial [Pseudomonadota bacterium]